MWCYYGSIPLIKNTPHLQLTVQIDQFPILSAVPIVSQYNILRHFTTGRKWRVTRSERTRAVLYKYIHVCSAIAMLITGNVRLGIMLALISAHVDSPNCDLEGGRGETEKISRTEFQSTWPLIGLPNVGYRRASPVYSTAKLVNCAVMCTSQSRAEADLKRDFHSFFRSLMNLRNVFIGSAMEFAHVSVRVAALWRR